MQLGGLGVDQVRRQRAGVEQEQRVRQRAVAPHEAGQVQPGEQLDHRVEQLGRWAGRRAGSRTAPGRRWSGRGTGSRVRRRGRPGRSTTTPSTSTAGMPSSRSCAQQAVLAPGQPLVQFLERVDLAALGDEPHDVPGDAALADLDQPLVLPVLDRLPPGQGEQAGRAARPAARRRSAWAVLSHAPATGAAGAGCETTTIGTAVRAVRPAGGASQPPASRHAPHRERRGLVTSSCPSCPSSTSCSSSPCQPPSRRWSLTCTARH